MLCLAIKYAVELFWYYNIFIKVAGSKGFENIFYRIIYLLTFEVYKIYNSRVAYAFVFRNYPVKVPIPENIRRPLGKPMSSDYTLQSYSKLHNLFAAVNAGTVFRKFSVYYLWTQNFFLRNHVYNSTADRISIRKYKISRDKVNTRRISGYKLWNLSNLIYVEVIWESLRERRLDTKRTKNKGQYWLVFLRQSSKSLCEV